MNTIKPIRTPSDHKKALAEIERLLETAKKGTEEGDRLEVLLTLAHAYEKKNLPLPRLDPIAAILFRIDQLGWDLKDLTAVFKTSGRTSEIMNKKRALSSDDSQAPHDVGHSHSGIGARVPTEEGQSARETSGQASQASIARASAPQAKLPKNSHKGRKPLDADRRVQPGGAIG